MKDLLIGIVTVGIVIKFVAVATVLIGGHLLAKKFVLDISKENTECKIGQKQN